ncbi:MAG TPA: glycerophosphodiester phosphodiesterase [Gaiellaceae bacterium]|nr:glycerophosphodiester phosphodiesterase [Gaiellaceae bacterium]
MRLRAEDGRFLRIAHRGAAALAAENSLAAIEAGLAADVDLVEFDVLEVEGRLVVAHAPELAVADAPALDAALELARAAPPEVGLDVDLKWHGFEARVVETIRRHGLVERTLVSSCFAPSLREVRKLEPRLATAFAYPFDRYRASERRVVPEALVRASLAGMRRTLPARIQRMLLRAEADVATLHWLVISPRLVERCHAAGAAVWAWTVNDADMIESVAAAGVDGIISDDPRLFAG